MSRISPLVALACVTGLALGACGSSDKGLSKADFVKQALAICTDSVAQATKISDSVGTDPTLSQVKDVYAKQLVPVLKDEVAQLRALKPPKADRETVSKMLDDLSAGIDESAAAIKSLKSTQDLTGLAPPAGLKAATSAANAYGIGKCTGI